jgi:hypothetical protein
MLDDLHPRVEVESCANTTGTSIMTCNRYNGFTAAQQRPMHTCLMTHVMHAKHQRQQRIRDAQPHTLLLLAIILYISTTRAIAAAAAANETEALASLYLFPQCVLLHSFDVCQSS